MALNPTQLVTAAEITQEILSVVTELASSLTAEQVTLIAADIVTWNLNRDDVDVWLEHPAGVNWQAQRLLDQIRMRVRKQFGLPLFSPEVQPGSMSIANVPVF
jgi:hypothetical protein